ncbi:MAG: hypothetical protein JST01_11085 [Cyanobacteria bacterium SZAS TMP-1]|nr:hypothetical protein [Cyanobacteria bacterium SZAS TMP-1]
MPFLTAIGAVAFSSCEAFAAEATRTIEFPREFSLGTLFIYPGLPGQILLPDSAGIKKTPGLSVWQARGRVTLPSRGYIYLLASYDLVEHPEVLSKLAPDAITCISFSKMGILQSLDKVIEPVSHLTGLKRLELQFAELPDARLKPIKNMAGLESLDLDMCGLRGTFLRDVGPLKNLKGIGLSDCRLVPQAFADLALFPNLIFLNLVRTGITDDGLSQVVKLSKLQTLYLANARITPKGLKYLTALKHLSVLELTDTDLQARDLLCLAPLKLSRIFLPRRYPPAEMELLQRSMPGTEMKFIHKAVDTDTKHLFAPLK